MTDETRGPVTIIGGGLAGLATAVGLARHGVRCTILESRPRLGGRASSFQDAATGQWIDNCQHVAMGCCTNFRAFCEWTGLTPYFRRERVLYFAAPGGRIHPFRADPLPAPLHLSTAFAGLSYLSWRDKWALARGLRALASETSPASEETFAAWLARHGQPPNAIQRFWTVVLVSALSESLNRIGVAEARKVFVDGFLRHRDAWMVDLPIVPLEDFYGSTLSQWLNDHHVDIQTLTAVERLQVVDGRVVDLVLRDGEVRDVDDCVLAVPFHRVRALLPDSLRESSEFSGITQLESAPITSVHLWFDRPITPLPHVVFVEGLVQWVFNRTAISGDKPAKDAGWYYQVVISASRDLQQQESGQTREQVQQELAAMFPEARTARLLNSRQVTEHRAVFSPLPGSSRLRPSQQTSIPNLQLAGDYTQTGWPATMEGAVRSGFLAAENILRQRGQSVRLLMDDLPTAPLARWLFGLTPEPVVAGPGTHLR